MPVVENLFMARSPTSTKRTSRGTAGRAEQGSVNLRSNGAGTGAGHARDRNRLARHRAVGTDLAQRVVRVIAELEPVWQFGPARGATGPRAGIPRRRGGGRAAGDADRAGRAVARRRRGRCRRGDGDDTGGNAALACQPGRRWCLPRVFAAHQVGEQRRAGSDHVRAASAGSGRRERRSACCAADAGARNVPAACPLWPSAIREPDRAGRAYGALRHHRVARAVKRPVGGVGPVDGRSWSKRHFQPQSAWC